MSETRLVFMAILIGYFVLIQPTPIQPPIDNTPIIVNQTIKITSNFDGQGRTYIHGPGLGDSPLMRVEGSGVTLRNCVFDDSVFRGQNGVLAISGTGNTIDGCKITNCERYGIITQVAHNWKIINCEVTKAQHGISGSTGYDGQWNPSTDGLIENCKISGIIIHGIKSKNWLRVTVRNNQIDCYPYYPTYTGGSTQYGKVGLVFGNRDSASVNVIVENNQFYEATPTTYNTYGVEATPDNLNGEMQSSGNIIRDNQFNGLNIGIYLQGDNFTAYRNTFLNCNTNIRNLGDNNYLS